MAFRRRTYSGAQTTVQKAKIFWDAGRSKYLIAAPFGADAFKNDIQIICSTAFWCGKQEPYWAIDECDLASAKVCVASYWPDFEFIEKPTRQQQNGGGGAVSTAANLAAIEMFRLAGYDTSRQVYSMLIKKYHPDTNPDPKAHAVAAQITVAWRKIKSELGW